MSIELWEAVIKRDDIVGGDLETQEDGIVYRGPVKEIYLRDGQVHIESDWIARLDTDTAVWTKTEASRFSVDCEYSPPIDIGQGRIYFGMIALGHGTIFPKGGSKLDPDNVRGLPHIV